MTIKTQNEDYGFWGTFRTQGYTDARIQGLWDAGIEALADLGAYRPEHARVILDSRDGRHLAHTVLGQVAPSRSIENVVRINVGEWCRSRRTRRAMDLVVAAHMRLQRELAIDAAGRPSCHRW